MNYIVYIKNLGFMRYSKIILLGFLLNLVNTGEAISSSSISNYNNNESLLYNSFDNTSTNVQQSNEETLLYCSQDNNKIAKLSDTDEKNNSENNILMREKPIANIVNNTHYFKFKSQENLNKVENMDCVEHAKSSAQICNIMLIKNLKHNLSTPDNDLSDDQKNNEAIQLILEKSEYTGGNSRKSTCISPIQNNNDKSDQLFSECQSQLSILSPNNTNISNNGIKINKRDKENNKKEKKHTRIIKKSLKSVKIVNKPSKFIDTTKLNGANNIDIKIDKNISILKNTNLLLQDLIQWKRTNNNQQASDKLTDVQYSINNRENKDKNNLILNSTNSLLQNLIQKKHTNNNNEKHNANTNMNHILIKHGAFEINYVKEQVKQLLSNCYVISHPNEYQNINDELISDKLIDDIITEIHVSGRNINQEKVKDLLNEIKDSIYPDKNVNISSNAFYSFLDNVNEYLYYFYSSKPLLKEQLMKDIYILLQKTKLQDDVLIDNIHTYIYKGRQDIVLKKITNELKKMMSQILNQECVMTAIANNIQKKIGSNFLA